MPILNNVTDQKSFICIINILMIKFTDTFWDYIYHNGFCQYWKPSVIFYLFWNLSSDKNKYLYVMIND